MDKADSDDSTLPDAGGKAGPAPAASRTVPAVTKAPAPVRSISGGGIYVPPKPSAPPVRYVPPTPPGTVAFAEIPDHLATNAETWSIPPGQLPGRADFRAIAQAVGNYLAYGEERAAGIRSDTGSDAGELVWVSRAIWRTSGFLKRREESAAFLAMSGEPLRLPGQRGTFECHVILPLRTLALAFGAAAPPDNPPQSVLDLIREVESRDREGSRAEPVKAKGAGGRKPSQDMWRPFWIEVALWAALHDLNLSSDCRQRLRKHLLQWAAEPGAVERPSEASIDRALRDLFAALALKTRLEGK